MRLIVMNKLIYNKMDENDVYSFIERNILLLNIDYKEKLNELDEVIIVLKCYRLSNSNSRGRMIITI